MIPTRKALVATVISTVAALAVWELFGKPAVASIQRKVFP